MAIENTVRLRGVIVEKPLVSYSESGQFALFDVNVIRADRKVGDDINYAKVDTIKIFTRDERILKRVANFDKFDVVDIKGILSTQIIDKKSYCSYCNHINAVKGSLVFVIPNFIERITGFKEEDERISVKNANRYLIDRREISNSIRVFGYLINNPKKLQTFSGLSFAQYQLYVKRSLLVEGQHAPEFNKGGVYDYPWVKSYGKNADSDVKRLKKGSLVYINGFLQQRYVERVAYCGQVKNQAGEYQVDSKGDPVLAVDANGNTIGCGKQYYWVDKTIEIVPFTIDYLSDFYDKEEGLKQWEDRLKQSRRDRENSLLRNSSEQEKDEDDSSSVDVGV